MRIPYAAGVVIALCLAPAGQARAQLNCNAGVDFHPDGGVRGCVLNGHHRLRVRPGVAVSCADGRRAEQHPDGTLALCTLLEPARLDGQDCPPGHRVRFTPAGTLERCDPSGAG